MKVVLLQDVDKLGRAFEIKEVADGFAGNYLLPRKLAMPATSRNLLVIEAKKKSFKNRDKQTQKNLAQVAGKLEGQTVIIKEKVQKNGKLYGSVGPGRVAEALKESGFVINEKQVILKNHLKEAGEFPAEINLGQGLKANIKILIQNIKNLSQK